MVVPSRRATAEAFQLLAAHAIGEAGAPYLVGLMADAFEEGMDYGYTEEYEYWAMQGRKGCQVSEGLTGCSTRVEGGIWQNISKSNHPLDIVIGSCSLAG